MAVSPSAASRVPGSVPIFKILLAVVGLVFVDGERSELLIELVLAKNF